MEVLFAELLAGSSERTTVRLYASNGRLIAQAGDPAAPEETTAFATPTAQSSDQSKPRIDIPASVNGTQVYGIDVTLPGMVYAAIAQSPVFGGTVVCSGVCSCGFVCGSASSINLTMDPLSSH